MKIQKIKKKFFWGGGGGGGGGRGWVWGGVGWGVRVDVNEEFNFIVKIKKKNFFLGGGGFGGGGRLGGLGWWDGWVG